MIAQRDRPRQTGQCGMVVPRFLRPGRAGEPITVCGDGEQSWSFTDADDTAGCGTNLLRNLDPVDRVRDGERALEHSQARGQPQESEDRRCQEANLGMTGMIGDIRGDLHAHTNASDG